MKTALPFPFEGRFPSFFLFLGGAWGLLIFHLSGEWRQNPQYGYGLAVPFLCAWILWIRRAELAEAFRRAVPPRKCSTLAYGVLALASMALLPIELLREVSPRLRSIGILGTLFCVACTAWTFRQLGAPRFPGIMIGVCALFATAVPWPSALESRITQHLMKGIAALTSDLLNVAGILAIQRGNLIELNTGLVSVDEACSGVRSLQSCLMASVALGLFFRLSGLRIGGLAGLGIGLALLGNVLRTLLLTTLAASKGLSSMGAFHDPAGVSILLGATFILYLSAQKLGDGRAPSESVVFPPLQGSGLPSARGITGVAVAAILGAHAWYWIHDASWISPGEPLLILREPPVLAVQEVPVPPAILAVLQPERGSYYQIRSSRWGEAAVYQFFWAPSPDQLIPFFHRPDVCMAGVGWEMTRDVETMAVDLDGKRTFWYMFWFERDGQKVIQAWGVWRDGIEQQLDFSRGWFSWIGQHLQRWQYIGQGRRRANTEIVSVVLDAQLADQKALRQVIQDIFAVRRNASHE